MVDRKDLIRYANHVTAVTEPLRGQSGAINYSKRALKSAQALMSASNGVKSAERKEQKRTLDSALSEFHKLEYVLDSLYAGKFISAKDYERLSDEGKEFRKAVIISIGEIRAEK